MDNLSIKLTADSSGLIREVNKSKSSLSSLNTLAKITQKSTSNITKNISAKINTSQYTQTIQAINTLVPVFDRISTKIDQLKGAFNLLNINMGVSVFRRVKVDIDALSDAMSKAGGSFTKFTSLSNNLSNNGFKKFEDGLVKIVYPLSFFQAKMRVVSDSLKKDGDKFGSTLFGLGSKVSAGLLGMTVGVGKAETATKVGLKRLATHLDNFVGKAISFKKVLAESWAESLWSSDMYKEIETVKKKLKDYDKMVEELAKKKEQYANLLSNAKNKTVTFEDIEEESRLYHEIANLKIKVKELKPKMDELRQTLAEITSGFKLFGHEVLNVAKHLGVFLVKLSSIRIALSAILLIVKSFTWTNQIANVNDEINDNSEKVNMTAEQYQKWSWIMKIAGSDASALKGHINQLNQRLKGADQESAKATKGFERLGISVYDANGEFRDSTELFEEAVSKLQKIENTTTRAAIATQIFGRNASELNGLLNMSAQEVEKITRVNNVLGLTASQSAIKLAGAYNDAKDVLAAVGNAMKSTISEIMIPWLIKLIKSIILAITYINIFVRTIFGLPMKSVTSNTKKASSSMSGYGNSVKKTTDKVKELKRQLLGFDELNVLQDNSSSSSGNTADAIGGLDISGINGDAGDTFSWLSDDELDRIERFQKKVQELQGTLQVVSTIVLILSGLFLVIFAFFGGGLPALIAGVTLIGLGIAVGNAEGADGESAFDKIKNKINEFSSNIKENIIAIVEILAGGFLVIWGFLHGNILAVVSGCVLVGVGILSLKDEDGVSVFDQLNEKLGGALTSIKENAVAICEIIAGMVLVVLGALHGNMIAFWAGVALIGLGIGSLKDENGKTVFEQLLEKMGASLKQLKENALAIGSIIAGIFLLVMSLRGWGIPALIAGAALIGLGIMGLKNAEGKTVFEQLIEKIHSFIMQFQGVISGLTAFFGLIAIVLGVIFGNIILLATGAGLIASAAFMAGMKDNSGKSLFDKIIEKGNKFITDNQALIAGLTAFFGLIALIVGVLTLNLVLIAAGAGLMAVSIMTSMKTDANGENLFTKITAIGKKFIIDNQALITGLMGFFGLIAVIIGVLTFNIPLLVAGGLLIGAAIFTGMQKNAEGESLFDRIGAKAKEAWENLKSWFKTNVSKIFTVEFWANQNQKILDALDNVLSSIWNKITGTISNIIGKVKEMCSNIAKKIKSLFTDTDKETDKAISKGNKKAKNTTSTSRVSRVSRVAAQMSNLQVPKLATGGVATKPTLVQIGEYSGANSNPEIVSPQSIMAETMQSANMEVINAIYAIGNQISKTVEDKDYDVYMDGDKLTSKVTKIQNKQSKNRGPSLVIV